MVSSLSVGLTSGSSTSGPARGRFGWCICFIGARARDAALRRLRSVGIGVRSLEGSDPDQALARAGATTSDWAGGTRLAAGISAFPMAARVAQAQGQRYNKKNYLLMPAMSANCAANGLVSVTLRPILISVFSGVGSSADGEPDALMTQAQERVEAGAGGLVGIHVGVIAEEAVGEAAGQRQELAENDDGRHGESSGG